VKLSSQTLQAIVSVSSVTNRAGLIKEVRLLISQSMFKRDKRYIRPPHRNCQRLFLLKGFTEIRVATKNSELLLTGKQISKMQLICRKTASLICQQLISRWILMVKEQGGFRSLVQHSN
jgi:hypothetical protein